MDNDKDLLLRSDSNSSDRISFVSDVGNEVLVVTGARVATDDIERDVAVENDSSDTDFVGENGSEIDIERAQRHVRTMSENDFESSSDSSSDSSGASSLPGENVPGVEFPWEALDVARGETTLESEGNGSEFVSPAPRRGGDAFEFGSRGLDAEEDKDEFLRSPPGLNETAAPTDDPFDPMLDEIGLGEDTNLLTVRSVKRYEAINMAMIWRSIRRLFCWSNFKIVSICIILVVAAYLFAFYKDDPTADTLHLAAVSPTKPHNAPVRSSPTKIRIWYTADESGQSGNQPIIRAALQKSYDQIKWEVVESSDLSLMSDEEIESGNIFFQIRGSDREKVNDTGPNFQISLSTNSSVPIGLSFQYSYVDTLQIVVAALILFFVYIVIIFELLHRTVAAMCGAVCALGALSKLKARPELEEVMGWIDFDTIGLLIGMMILVGVFSQTGFFEWAAVKAYKLARGKLWRLTVFLCLFVMIVSAFLDNVTTILLVLPCTIRLCSVFDVDPVYIILAEVMLSNIGGTATIIGDPPNILIASDRRIKAANVPVSFMNFMLHMTPGVLAAAFFTFPLLKFLIKKKLQTKENLGKLTEIKIWRRTARKLRTNLDEEKRVKEYLNRYIDRLQAEVKAQSASRRKWPLRRRSFGKRRDELESETDSTSAMESNEDSAAAKKARIKELEEKYRIHNRPLFIQSIVVLMAVIIMFFVHSALSFTFALAWIAVLGALTLLIVAGIRDVDEILEKVEWGTLLFFAALFILMHALEELGLIMFVAGLIQDVIAMVPEGNGRLAVAIIIIVMVSGVVSSFMDNIPFALNMIPIVSDLAGDELGLPLGPLVWALSFGCCFGGNGTLVGASANVVAAGISEQQGHPIRFLQFTKIGYPVMLQSLVVATVYLLIFHVLIPWY